MPYEPPDSASGHAQVGPIHGPQAGASPISHAAADGKRLGRAATRDTRVVADPLPPDLTTIRLPDGTALRVKR
jgi:hypothetical protein